MPRPLKWGILGAGTIILSGDIHNYILCMVRIFMDQTLFENQNSFSKISRLRLEAKSAAFQIGILIGITKEI